MSRCPWRWYWTSSSRSSYHSEPEGLSIFNILKQGFMKTSMILNKAATLTKGFAAALLGTFFLAGCDQLGDFCRL